MLNTIFFNVQVGLEVQRERDSMKNKECTEALLLSDWRSAARGYKEWSHTYFRHLITLIIIPPGLCCGSPAPAILFGLTSWDNSDKVLSLTTQTILFTFSTPDVWRFLDTDNHAAVLWQPVSKVTYVCVCVCVWTLVRGCLMERWLRGWNMAKDIQSSSLTFWEVCDEAGASVSDLFFSLSLTPNRARPPILSLLRFSSRSPRLVPKPSTIHQRTSRLPLCNNSAISGGKRSVTMHETTSFFNQLSETNNARWQTLPTTTKKHAEWRVIHKWKTKLQSPFIWPQTRCWEMVKREERRRRKRKKWTLSH